MIVEMTKTLHGVLERDYFIIYGSPSHKDTNVFHEWFDTIKTLDIKKYELIEFVRAFKPNSKSRCSVYIEDTRILFCKPNRSVFPVFYIEFK